MLKSPPAKAIRYSCVTVAYIGLLLVDPSFWETTSRHLWPLAQTSSHSSLEPGPIISQPPHHQLSDQFYEKAIPTKTSRSAPYNGHLFLRINPPTTRPTQTHHRKQPERKARTVCGNICMGKPTGGPPPSLPPISARIRK